MLRNRSQLSGVGMLGLSYDPDAQAYFTAGEAAGGTMSAANKAAVDAFVRGCKADASPMPGVSNWAAIKASCLLCAWDNLTGALVPLRGSAPTNTNFVSGDYSRTLGLKGDGSTKYLTSARGNADDPQNNKALCCYISQATAAAVMSMVGSGNSAGHSTLLTDSAGGVYARINYTTVGKSGAGAPQVGFAGASRENGTGVSWRYNGASGIFSDVSSVPIAGSIDVFRRSSGNYFTGGLSFYSIGEAVDLALLDARLSTLMSSLT